MLNLFIKIFSNYKQIIGLFAVILSYVLLSIFAVGCANSSMGPTGGQKDTIAPLLIKMSPNQRTTDFEGTELVFTFNEYVELKNQNKNFIISPPLPGKRPILKIKGKSIVVTLPSVAQDVTYYLDFGASVVDVNEGNPADYLNFIFSTGNILDTMIYAGRVVNAYTLEPIEGANVFLYENNNDSIIFKTNPSALSITNKEGVFIIKGLKNRKYKAVAISDKNNNMRYDAGAEELAFSDSLIQPIAFSGNDSIPFHTLPIFNVFTENLKKQTLSESKRPEERLISLVFNEINPVINSFAINGLTPAQIMEEHSLQRDTINYWITSRTVSDTITGNLIYLKTDTTNNLSPDTVNIKLPYNKPGNRKGKDKEEEEEIIPIEPSIAASNTSIVEKDVIFNFKTPLLKTDLSKISLFIFDDEGKEKIPEEITSFKQDTIGIRRYKLSAKWEVASKYELSILPEAFIDIYSITNDTITKNFDTADPEKYGRLTIDVTNSDKQYILQLMRDKTIVQEKTIKGNSKTVFQYLNAGKYRIKVIEDANANNKWDTGNYWAKKQPERTEFLIFSNGDDVLEVKSNWEHEQTIDASTLFN